MNNYKTYYLKLQLTKTREEYLHRLFNEAKWFYNMLLSDGIKTERAKLKIVNVLNPITEKQEERKLLYLNSQMKQEIIKRTIGSLKSLKTRKTNNGKIGYLKYKSFINSIPLKNQTFSFDNNNRLSFMGNYKLKFKVKGLQQIEDIIKIASGCIIRKPSGYYLAITGEFPLNNKEKQFALGVDMGIKSSLSFSNGQIFDKINLPESDRLKRIQKYHAKSKKGSNNRNKLIHKLNYEYEKIDNKKKEIANQLLNILNNYHIIIQDENLSGWHKGLFGKQVQHSALGLIKTKLIMNGSSVVDKFLRTTRCCSACGEKLEFGMDTREFVCPECKTKLNRDVNAALNILKIGLDESEYTPLEMMLDFSKLNTLMKQWSQKKETTHL